MSQDQERLIAAVYAQRYKPFRDANELGKAIVIFASSCPGQEVAHAPVISQLQCLTCLVECASAPLEKLNDAIKSVNQTEKGLILTAFVNTLPARELVKRATDLAKKREQMNGISEKLHVYMARGKNILDGDFHEADKVRTFAQCMQAARKVFEHIPVTDMPSELNDFASLMERAITVALTEWKRLLTKAANLGTRESFAPFLDKGNLFSGMERLATMVDLIPDGIPLHVSALQEVVSMSNRLKSLLGASTDMIAKLSLDEAFGFHGDIVMAEWIGKPPSDVLKDQSWVAATNKFLSQSLPKLLVPEEARTQLVEGLQKDLRHLRSQIDDIVSSSGSELDDSFLKGCADKTEWPQVATISAFRNRANCLGCKQVVSQINVANAITDALQSAGQFFKTKSALPETFVIDSDHSRSISKLRGSFVVLNNVLQNVSNPDDLFKKADGAFDMMAECFPFSIGSVPKVIGDLLEHTANLMTDELSVLAYKVDEASVHGWDLERDTLLDNLELVAALVCNANYETLHTNNEALGHVLVNVQSVQKDLVPPISVDTDRPTRRVVGGLNGSFVCHLVMCSWFLLYGCEGCDCLGWLVV